MDGDALSNHLRAHPEDVATWLVYGDWLLEHGDRRGELIRLAGSADPAAQARTEELIAALREVWRREVSAAIDVTIWRHGFALALAVPWPAAGDALAAVLASPEARFVRTLRLTYTEPAGGNDDEDDEGEDDDDDDEGDAERRPVNLAALAGVALDHITELDLRYLPLDGACGAVLGELALDALEVLDLRYTRLGDAGITALAKSTHLGKLRRLALQRNAITHSGATALADAALPGLAELDLRYNPIGPTGAARLAGAAFAPGLVRLDLHREDVDPEGVTFLAEAAQLRPSIRTHWRAR